MVGILYGDFFSDSDSDYGCIQVKPYNYFNNYGNYNFIFSELDDVAKLLN